MNGKIIQISLVSTLVIHFWVHVVTILANSASAETSDMTMMTTLNPLTRSKRTSSRSDSSFLSEIMETIGMCMRKIDLIDTNLETRLEGLEKQVELMKTSNVEIGRSLYKLAKTFGASSGAACTYALGHVFNKSDECRIADGRLIFQLDGNMVIYDDNGRPKWDTKTDGRADRFVFQDDGNLVAYKEMNEPVWSSKTVGLGHSLVFQYDRNLVIFNNASEEIWSTNPTIV